MRKREEIENNVMLDHEHAYSTEVNQALMIEVLLDIREKLEENSAILNIEHMTEMFREAKKED